MRSVGVMVAGRAPGASRAVPGGCLPFEPIEKDDEAFGECQGGDEIE